MAKAREKKPLDKKNNNWTQTFNLVGEAKISEYTFKIDKQSEKSDWIYNQLNLQVNCGEKSGNVGCEMMSGYGRERNNKVYVHGKKEDGTDDFKNNYSIDWDDRFDEDILDDIGDLCFIKIGLEKDTKGNTCIKKFLTPYDAIAYIHENLEDGMVINVKGNLQYSMYNGELQCKKVVNSIFLSSAKPEDYKATFLQTFLIDKDSASKENIDKEKKVMYVDAYLLEKFKEFNGWDLTEDGKVKGGIYVPLRKRFEFDLTSLSTEQTVQTINQYFKVKKNVDQLTFQGVFIESGATVKATEADIPNDLKDLVATGTWTMEDLLALCTTNEKKERRMVLTRLHVKLTGDDNNKTLQKQQIVGIYEDDDLILDCLTPKNVEEEEVPFDEDTSEDDDLAALLSQLN